MDSSKAKRLKTTERREPTEEKCITEPASHPELKKIIVQDFTRKGTTEKKAVTFAGEKFAGNGAFGVVYQTKIVETGETVAVKKVFQDKRYKNREFQILKALDHPNVIKMKYAFLSSGESDEDVYLNVVMDYMPESLYDLSQSYAKRKQLFPNTLLKLYCYQMFRGLAYIHGLGICHRDIKPQNILVNNSACQLRICDFGSAKQLIEGEPNISYICSRYYRAPELIFGNTSYTTALDVWSTGCVIGELLLNEPLFPGDSNSDQLLEIIKVLGTPTDEQVRSMNPALKEFVFPYIQPCPWKKVFKSEVDPLLLDLLSKVLTYSPQKRLHPLEALLHPYFDELRDRNFKVGGKQVSNLFDFTPEELSLRPDLASKLAPSWYSL
jgi:glycogen synthase kinase 3 beta